LIGTGKWATKKSTVFESQNMTDKDGRNRRKKVEGMFVER
jgi:hypothetical protein